MSTTPRTDKQIETQMVANVVPAAFARELETELSAESAAKYRACGCAADAIEERDRLREALRKMVSYSESIALRFNDDINWKPINDARKVLEQTK